MTFSIGTLVSSYVTSQAIERKYKYSMNVHAKNNKTTNKKQIYIYIFIVLSFTYKCACMKKCPNTNLILNNKYIVVF